MKMEQVWTLRITEHDPERIPWIREALGNTVFSGAHYNWRSFRGYGNRILTRYVDQQVKEEEKTVLEGIITVFSTEKDLAKNLRRFWTKDVKLIKEANRGSCKIQVDINPPKEEEDE